MRQTGGTVGSITSSLVVGRWASLEAGPWRAAQTSEWCPERCQSGIRMSTSHHTMVGPGRQPAVPNLLHWLAMFNWLHQARICISQHMVILLWPLGVKVKCKGSSLCLGRPVVPFLGGKKPQNELSLGWDLLAWNLNSLEVFISFKDQNNKIHTGTARAAAVFQGIFCNSLPRETCETSYVGRRVKFFPCVR